MSEKYYYYDSISATSITIYYHAIFNKYVIRYDTNVSEKYHVSDKNSYSVSSDIVDILLSMYNFIEK